MHVCIHHCTCAFQNPSALASRPVLGALLGKTTRRRRRRTTSGNGLAPERAVERFISRSLPVALVGGVRVASSAELALALPENALDILVAKTSDGTLLRRSVANNGEPRAGARARPHVEDFQGIALDVNGIRAVAGGRHIAGGIADEKHR